MINNSWLRTFCTLAEVEHFTRTAEQLHMTQSGVSQHVQKLEAHLGVPLLLRDSKQVVLTEAGKRLRIQAQHILQSLSDLEVGIGEDPAFEGEVKVMSPGSVGLRLYPHLLALQACHPKLIIDHRFAPNQAIEKAVAGGDADIGFTTVQAKSADIISEVIATEPLLLVTPAEVNQPDWEMLLSLGFIDHPDGAHHAELLLSANYMQFRHCSEFERKGFSNQISLILEPVSRGLGFTVLPAYAVEAFARHEQIKVHTLAHPVSETIYLCTTKRGILPARVDTVIEHAKTTL
ncbi:MULTISPECIES: LysR family transcriptional regulator [unclassified Pseudoalteromonas]|uniref:LysR family transcriptional regulator n=1 Tax=unclassified Pseudoalteromonas TaxID=194690 RepID=UPI002097DBEC|nr:LysR family transcriptional regulator [Pseudoalteromonas sp. XMcav2-N]MCO7191212.1 LysR family transcriptional regulator [Pseudoalteromonas sp. XMcav2-N]